MSKFHGLTLGRVRKEGCRKRQSSSSLSFLFRCSHSFVTRFFLGLVLYSILFPCFQFCFQFFFLAEKTMLFFQTLFKGTLNLLTCHLQFDQYYSQCFHTGDTNDNQCKVFQTTKQPVLFAQAKNARTVERMVWSKTNGCVTLLSGAGGRE